MLLKGNYLSAFSSLVQKHYKKPSVPHHICACWQHHSNVEKAEKKTLSSKDIRNIFVNYFVQDKYHTYVHSSPIVPRNDPSLLYVNAGMNQFKPLLLNSISPKHPFYHLKRAANSQKCIRVGGKHNDLNDVGKDLYHHSFFEMLGNWSFGDYFKREACTMSWELLTKIYGLDPSRLYITYFGGDSTLGLAADEECKRIWLDLGVPEDHIFPFGVKDNFWEMGDEGPCGPCTEIHYDHQKYQKDDLSPQQRINANRHDLVEIWNLVFIQHKRRKNGTLGNLQFHSVDTGMGLERLTAVLQGSVSNYDTDIFTPLFKAIEKNFNVRPYLGRTGTDDIDGIDTAYRILADHARMFTVTIADEVFPDEYDAGHLLRTIIRKAAYVAKQNMKAPPGSIASLIPYVVESLGDFYPELGKKRHIADIVNEEEERFLRQLKSGRKVLNKMVLEAKNGILEGKKAWDLHFIHGLQEQIIQNMAAEKGLIVDWTEYQKQAEDQKKHNSEAISRKGGKHSVSSQVLEFLQSSKVPVTDDVYKYNCHLKEGIYYVEPISSKVLAVIENNSLVQEAQTNQRCLVVTDKTNFYSEAGGQVADNGQISNESFAFHVENAYILQGYVFHEGWVHKGNIYSGCEVQMSVNKTHRQKCMLNHTASHLLNSALRKILPYTAQRSAYIGPSYLRLDFSAKTSLSLEQVDNVEIFVNRAIEQKLQVRRDEMSLAKIQEIPNIITLPGEEYPDPVTIISIGQDRPDSVLMSIEPCCGTHVQNTSDIGQFVVVSQKSNSQMVKTIRAVTGEHAQIVLKEGEKLDKQISTLQSEIEKILEEENPNSSELLKLLKEVKRIKGHTLHEALIPFKKLRKYEWQLQQLTVKLTRATKSLFELELLQKLNEELHEAITKNPKEKYLIHHISKSQNSQNVLKLALTCITDRPVMLFVEDRRNNFLCSCIVPEEFVCSSFSALLWIQPVATLLEASSGGKSKDPEKNFTVTVNNVDKLNEAIAIARNFAKVHL